MVAALVVSVSQNARNMRRDAFPHPERYRLQFFAAGSRRCTASDDRTVDDGRAGRATDDVDQRATTDGTADHADYADHARLHGAADHTRSAIDGAVDGAVDRCAGDGDQRVSDDVDDIDDDRLDDHDDDHRLLDVVDHFDVRGAVRAVIGGRARQTSCASSPSGVACGA